jgi:hypothetical protein
MLGVHGPVGPLGITDERGSYSLSRKLIGLVPKTVALLQRASLEPSSLSWMGIRETLILTELKDGKVTTQEVAEHKESKDFHFGHERYQEKWILSRRQDISWDVREQDCLDFTRAHHRILPVEGIVPTPLKDQEGKIVEDAETVVAANWYVLVLTRSGDLYFNQDLYMKNVRSIVDASSYGFTLTLNKHHMSQIYGIQVLDRYLKGEDNRGNKVDFRELRSHGFYFGDRDSSLPVVGPSVYTENILGKMMLRADGRLESDFSIPLELENHLRDKSNYVKSVVVSRYHFATLLQLGNESQEVYVWGDEVSRKVDFKTHSCFEKKNPETGKTERKRIADIAISDNSLNDVYNFFMPTRGHPQDAIAFNFEDNSSCLLSISEDGDELSVLASFPSEHTRSIHNTADGMLVVTDSKIFKITEAGQSLDIVTDSDRRYVSFVASPDGYVIVYPDGEHKISESVRPPTDIEDKITRGGGIAEIHHDRSGTFHAILRNGTFVSWYIETSVVFRNTPKWDMDKSLSVL